MSMKVSSQNQPLTEAELDRLQKFLKNCKGGKAMNIEEMDGFFAALVAGPDNVMPSEYLPVVFGSERGKPMSLRVSKKPMKSCRS